MRCGACDTELRSNARYCDACGVSIAAGSRHPRDYTPRHLAERILTLRSAIEGEHKQVTVLFVDVKGSMGLAEAVDLEAWHAIMNRFFEIASASVHAFEGTINQFTGDGVMALFGAPIAHEDHARRACHAALGLRQELDGLASELRRTRQIEFTVRMGLNSGEVVVGRIGDDLRMDYTAQGHTVGLAARMEQLAEAGAILVSEATAALVEGFFQLRELGPTAVKGASEPVRVHLLEEVGSLRTRLDAARSRGFTPFLGREPEMQVLETALEAAAAGRGGVLGLSGDAGVGKSRLCFEFAERCQARGIRVRVAQAVAHGRSVPFLPLLELLRDFFGIAEADSSADARRKIANAALLLDEELEPSLPLLFDFLGVPEPGVPSRRLDPEARRDQLIDAVMRLVRARSGPEPAVLLFEDLHWLDAASEAFLERLVAVAGETHTLVVVNFQPGFRTRWMEHPAYTELSVEPLGEIELRDLVDLLVGAHPSTAELRRALQQRAAGSPFFVEEAVQSLLEDRQLEPGEGGLRLVGALERLEVPATVQAVLGARIDRLGQIQKRLLQTAAVIGRSFPEALLSRVVGLHPTEFARALRDLEEAGFFQRLSHGPAAVHAFRHPLILEVAYATQLADARARVHAAVASALEELQPERLDEMAALLAHHAEAAVRPLDAARWHRRAAQWVGVRDVEAAHRHWRAVLDALERAPDCAEKNELGVQAHVWLQQLAWRLGFSEEEAAEIHSRGLALARSSGDRTGAAMISTGYAVCRGVMGDDEGQVRYAASAAREADELGNLPLSLGTRVVMASALYFQGRLREALDVADGVMARRPEEDPGFGARAFWIGPYTYLLGLRGALHSLLGRLGTGERDVTRALELAHESGDAEAAGCSHGFAVQHARCARDAEAAAAHAEQMVELAERTGIPLLLIDGTLALGQARLLGEHWGEATAALERALEMVEARRIRGQRRRILAALAEARVGAGEPERARQLAGQLLAAGRPRAQLVDLTAHLVLARCATFSESEREAGHEHVAAAVDLVAKSGAQSLEPEIHRLLAGLAECDGDAATQARHLRRAERLQLELARQDDCTRDANGENRE